MSCRKRVGIVGFGRLGQFLFEEIRKRDTFEVAFVWNRTAEKMEGVVEDKLVLQNLRDCASKSPDLIVEVAHPQIVAEYGAAFLQVADFLVGSPTALADDGLREKLTQEAKVSRRCLFIATGALWGALDIQKMADIGTLQGLKVTMKKHPSNFKVVGRLVALVESVKEDPVILYEGPVRELCQLAPNNVNTMACACIAAHNLGFDKVVGCLVADPRLSSHIVEVEVEGPGAAGNQFTVSTVRNNPSSSGVVTGKQTYMSFLNSMISAGGTGKTGILIC